jgi:putative flippase GtrA
VTAARTEGANAPRPLTTLLEHGAALLTAIGLAVYGTVRVGLDAFYSILGVTPEEVGLSYITVLSRAVLGLVVPVIISSAAAGAWLIVFSYMWHTSGFFEEERVAHFRSMSEMVTLLYLYSLFAVITIGLVILTGGLLIIATSILGFVLISQRVVSPVKRAVPPKRSTPITQEQINYNRFRGHVISIFLMGVLLTGILTASQRAGSEAAERVIAGREVKPSRIFGLPWLGALSVEAECTTIRYVGDAKSVPATLLPPKAIYLGQANSMLVVYVPKSGPLRLPVGSFAIQAITTDDCSN